MCGITGWIDNEKDISEKEVIIKAMTNTLKRRGPDDYGFYISKHALLGHRRLIVVDPIGGAQPMTRNIGNNRCTIVYNGELYNTEELRKELKNEGFSFKSYSDTEVLLVSYMAWGEDCVKKLNGIFAFGIYDEYKKKIFIARDPLGVKPLFYSIIGSSIIFGSEIKAILAHPEVEPVIDREGLCELFGLGPGRSLGSGLFKYIKEVPPAHFLSFSPLGVKLEEYWKLKSEPHKEDLDTTCEHVRNLLIDAIERQLGADVPVCTFLSGGLDSSAISSIAANAFKRNGNGILNTYSVDYLNNNLYFKASEFQPTSDSDFTHKMSDYLESSHHDVIINTPQLASALADAVRANDMPGMADVDSSLYLFCKEVKKNATVAVSGECADEVFGGYPWYRREEDINANTFPWSKFVKDRCVILSKDLKKLPLEEYVALKYKETIDAVPKLEGESQRESRMREMYYLNIKWFMMTLLNRKDRMSMANSLEVRVPFADHRIVEYAFNIPWSMKYCDGIEKGLLRRALKGLLPEEVRMRRKSPYPKTHNPSYSKAVQKWMSEILNDKTSPILQLIDKEKVSEIVETEGRSYTVPWYGQLMKGPQLIAYLIQVNEWLKEYKVQIIN